LNSKTISNRESQPLPKKQKIAIKKWIITHRRNIKTIIYTCDQQNPIFLFFFDNQTKPNQTKNNPKNKKLLQTSLTFSKFARVKVLRAASKYSMQLLSLF